MKTLREFKEEILLTEREKMHLHIKKGAFHAWLGKDPSEPITNADIQRGLAAGGHAAKMANFAKNARRWHHESMEVGKHDMDFLHSRVKKWTDIKGLHVHSLGHAPNGGVYFQAGSKDAMDLDDYHMNKQGKVTKA